MITKDDVHVREETEEFSIRIIAELRMTQEYCVCYGTRNQAELDHAKARLPEAVIHAIYGDLFPDLERARVRAAMAVTRGTLSGLRATEASELIAGVIERIREAITGEKRG